MQHKSIYNLHKNQGYYKAPAGSSKAQQRCVLGKSFFNKKVLEIIDSNAIQTFTSKYKYNCNMVKAVRGGPSYLEGAEFTPLYHVQVTALSDITLADGVKSDLHMCLRKK
eukprot:9366405-Ditylum_brightwellii.AAC.1